jgi:hypothetical protein
MEHPTAERSGPLPLVRYACGADVTGYPRHPAIPTLSQSPETIPERRPAGGGSRLEDPVSGSVGWQRLERSG